MAFTVNPGADEAARTGRSRIATGLLALLAMLIVAAVARAQDEQALYTAQVPINPNDPAARESAYETALAEVLVRITGSRYGLDPELAREWFPNPSRYVLQYRPGEDSTLWVMLDGAAIEAVLRQERQTVWSARRPLTLVWLAVDWGQGEREIIGADDPERTAAETRSMDRSLELRERINEVAQQRGVPVAFPLLDAEDLSAIEFSDIWGGFDEKLIAASERYGASSVLVGRIRPGTSQENRWSYYFDDERREWSGEPEEAVNLLADFLAARFAIAGDAQLQTVDLTVSGIDSVAAYGAVQSFMENLDAVQDVSIDSVSGDRIHYRLRTHGGVQRLRQALAANRRLEPVEDPVAGMFGNMPADELEYRYRH